MPRLAIIGMGRMGRTIEQLASGRGFDVVSRIDPAGGDAASVSRDALANADVAVEFTTPEAAPANVLAALAAGCPVVVGTTGWYERRAEVEARARETGAVLIAPNFSVGVAAFSQILAAAARALRAASGFDVHMIETHHAAKKDAPSGTAASLAQDAAAAWGQSIPITSVRLGAVPGTHEVIFDGAFEQIRLAHVARDRRVFADGALLAARWLVGRRGVYTMQDVIAGAEPGAT